jgi:hypothetical protein
VGERGSTRKRQKIPITRGSGNVYADLGFPIPAEELAKAELVYTAGQTIVECGLTQRGTAALVGVDQPKVPRLPHGRLRVVAA